MVQFQESSTPVNIINISCVNINNVFVRAFVNLRS